MTEPPIVATVARKPYTPETTGLGTARPAWGSPVDVQSHGWWQPTADEVANTDPGRRGIQIVRNLMVVRGTDCGDRDRWTLPGDGTYEQAGEPQDYSHGPFGQQTPLLVYLKAMEG